MFRSLISVVIMLLFACNVFAEEKFGTPQEAETLVGKVIQALKTDRDNTLIEITAKSPKWFR